MRKTKSGFTIVEILIVIAIIGVLSTLSTVAYSFARTQAKITKARHEVDEIAMALKMLESDTGQWPQHQDVDEVDEGASNEVWNLNAATAGLVATDGDFSNWNGPYMQAVPPDSWGHDYFYDSDYQRGGVNYIVVGSFGPNGVGPNVYDSDDIIKVLR